MIDAPVVAYRRGQGVVSARHKLSVSLPIGHRLWKDADVVVGIGTRLLIGQNEWGLDTDLKILRIDIDPDEPAASPDQTPRSSPTPPRGSARCSPACRSTSASATAAMRKSPAIAAGSPSASASSSRSFPLFRPCAARCPRMASSSTR